MLMLFQVTWQEDNDDTTWHSCDGHVTMEALNLVQDEMRVLYVGVML